MNQGTNEALARALGEYILQLSILFKRTRLHVTEVIPPDRRTELRPAQQYSQFDIGRLVGELFKDRLEYDAPSGWFTLPETTFMDHIKKQCRELIAHGLRDNIKKPQIQLDAMQLLSANGIEAMKIVPIVHQLYKEEQQAFNAALVATSVCSM